MPRKENSVPGIGEIKNVLLGRKLELEDILVRLYKEKFSDGQVQDFGDQAISSTMESLRASLQLLSAAVACARDAACTLRCHIPNARSVLAVDEQPHS